MTTAEFIIGLSPDDAAERKAEGRKILWALLAALGIHLLIGYSLAVYGGLLYTPFSVSEEDKPVELTFVDLATPAPVKNAMFIPNDESKQTEQPKEKTFESNANSIGASENAAKGNLPLPSQEGVERNAIDLDSHRESLATEGAQAQPSVAEQSATPQPSATIAPLQPAQPAHAAGGAHAVKLADGGAAPASEAGAPLALPSGLSIPNIFPSGLPPMPSGIPTTFPSGLTLPGFGPVDAGKK